MNPLSSMSSMPNMTRRDCLKGTLAAVGGALVPTAPSFTASSTPTSQPSTAKGGRIVLCEVAKPGRMTTTLLQMGLTHVIAPMRLRGTLEEQTQQVAQTKAAYEAAGVKITGVEGAPVSFEKIKLGLDGRDEEIQNFINAIQALSQAGIRMICYNWMAGLGWTRTSQNVPFRGGAVTSEFELQAAERMGETRFGKVSEEKIWDNLVYFQKAVIPVAEKFGVQMALHPDDPPISPLRGIGRILTSAANYRKAINIVPSAVNGITFCQANFKLMGEDIYALAREWCAQKKVFFVHLRDVEGTREHFREVFHDDCQVDMARILKIYAECGCDLPLRPDHAPMMEGDGPEQASGYGVVGKVLAFGYIMGLLKAQNIAYT
jgi:mannonate dehydratase